MVLVELLVPLFNQIARTSLPVFYLVLDKASLAFVYQVLALPLSYVYFVFDRFEIVNVVYQTFLFGVFYVYLGYEALAFVLG